MVFENVAKKHQVSHQNLEEAFIRVPYIVQLLSSHTYYDDITLFRSWNPFKYVFKGKLSGVLFHGVTSQYSKF